jgi:hypothetical protein
MARRLERLIVGTLIRLIKVGPAVHILDGLSRHGYNIKSP